MVVIGRNGAGKSSLLRCLAGVQEPTDGDVELGVNVALGYFAQEHEQVDPSRQRARQHRRRAPDKRVRAPGAAGLVRPASARPPTRCPRPCRAASGRSSVWPCWPPGQANVLLLDEPTNNLDPSSIEAVGTMLAGWPGTIVVVSHDRAFVEALEPTHALKLPDEVFTHWRDDYLDMVEMK